MIRIGQHAKLKLDMIEAYKKLHAAAWTEVLATIAKCNIKNYSIYLTGNDLFAYYEYNGNNFDVDMAKMETDPVTQKWWEQTKPCFLHHDKKIYYSDMSEIFHWD